MPRFYLVKDERGSRIPPIRFPMFIRQAVVYISHGHRLDIQGGSRIVWRMAFFTDVQSDIHATSILPSFCLNIDKKPSTLVKLERTCVTESVKTL